MSKKISSAYKKKLVGGILGLGVLLVGAAVSYKAAVNTRLTDLSARASETVVSSQALLKAWEFNGNEREGWDARGSIRVGQFDGFLYAFLRNERNGGTIENSRVNATFGQGRGKSITFRAALVPFMAYTYGGGGRPCPQYTITCPNGNRQSALTAQCLPNTCPAITPTGTSPSQACPQDMRICPDGTTLQREGSTCQFPACPINPSPVELVIKYKVGDTWKSTRTVRVDRGGSYREYAVIFPETESLNISKIRFELPKEAYGYVLSLDWIRLAWLVPTPTPTTTRPTLTPTPTTRPTPTPTTTSRAKCVKSTECSGLARCSEEGLSGGGSGSCVWREEYSCYQQAECKRQASGECGWTQPQLDSCLSKYNPTPASEADCNRLTPPECDRWGQICYLDGQYLCRYRPLRGGQQTPRQGRPQGSPSSILY